MSISPGLPARELIGAGAVELASDGERAMLDTCGKGVS